MIVVIQMRSAKDDESFDDEEEETRKGCMVDMVSVEDSLFTCIASSSDSISLSILPFSPLSDLTILENRFTFSLCFAVSFFFKKLTAMSLSPIDNFLLLLCLIFENLKQLKCCSSYKKAMIISTGSSSLFCRCV